jgi:Phosphopantetheinyl transferase
LTLLEDSAVDTRATYVGRIESVDIWRGRLDLEQPVLTAMWMLLSDEERQTAHAYRSEELQRRFIVRRGLLRQLLSDLLEMPPHSVKYG